MSIDTIKVYRDLMGNNERWARENQALLRDHRLAMVNLIGSPGSGKTALLEHMVPTLRDHARFAVLEGDIETTRDAERLDVLDVPVSQLLSGGACHLEAKLVNHALADLALDDLDVVFVENVGNMVCPSGFDLGEDLRVMLVATTEGEDKPRKYPTLTMSADVALISKIDLAEAVECDVDLLAENLDEVRPGIPIVHTSARRGTGVGEWLDLLRRRADAKAGALAR